MVGKKIPSDKKKKKKWQEFFGVITDYSTKQINWSDQFILPRAHRTTTQKILLRQVMKEQGKNWAGRPSWSLASFDTMTLNMHALTTSNISPLWPFLFFFVSNKNRKEKKKCRWRTEEFCYLYNSFEESHDRPPPPPSWHKRKYHRV
jgi:hypothetical protein